VVPARTVLTQLCGKVTGYPAGTPLLKQDPDLPLIPVVMLTTSQAEEDILRSYKLHANAYVSKPVDSENFVAAIRQIDDFFLTLVQLPR
jgi:CheY-like chemotaxis protein